MRIVKRSFFSVIILTIVILAIDDMNSSNTIKNIDLNISNLIIDDGLGILNNSDTEILRKN